MDTHKNTSMALFRASGINLVKATFSVREWNPKANAVWDRLYIFSLRLFQFISALFKIIQKHFVMCAFGLSRIIDAISHMKTYYYI